MNRMDRIQFQSRVRSQFNGCTDVKSAMLAFVAMQDTLKEVFMERMDILMKPEDTAFDGRKCEED